MPWKVEGVCLIETFRVGSVVGKSHKYMFVTVYNIYECKVAQVSENLIEKK